MKLIAGGDQGLISHSDRANKGDTSKVEGMGEAAKGMVLPFKPLNLTFVHLWYSVDFPKVGLRISCALPLLAELCGRLV